MTDQTSPAGVHHVADACRDLTGFRLVHTAVETFEDGGSFRHLFDDTGDGSWRMELADVEPLMEIGHGWCQSLYSLDPNGIMVEFCRGGRHRRCAGPRRRRGVSRASPGASERSMR